MDEADGESTPTTPPIVKRKTVEVTVTLTFHDTLMSETDAYHAVMRKLDQVQFNVDLLRDLEKTQNMTGWRNVGDKNVVTVALLQAFIFNIAPNAPDSVSAALRDLWPQAQTKFNADGLRGLAGAAVAMLRAADMKPGATKAWMQAEVNRLMLDFRASDAIRWFYDYSQTGGSSNPPSVSRRVFDAFRPEFSGGLTEDKAKEQASGMLEALSGLKTGPLRRQKRRG